MRRGLGARHRSEPLAPPLTPHARATLDRPGLSGGFRNDPTALTAYGVKLMRDDFNQRRIPQGANRGQIENALSMLTILAGLYEQVTGLQRQRTPTHPRALRHASVRCARRR